MSNYEPETETIKPDSKEFSELWTEFPSPKEFDDILNTTRIKESIIDLTDSLNTEEDLWKAWKSLNEALNYLSAKHTMARVKEGGEE
jgi:hypothetical protein